MCPYNYPFAYNQGSHCCKTQKEKEVASEGPPCDGGELSMESSCCYANQQVECPGEDTICTDYVGMAKDNLDQTIDKLYKTWSISFDLYPQSPYQTSRMNIIHLTTEAKGNSLRIPGLWFQARSAKESFKNDYR